MLTEHPRAAESPQAAAPASGGAPELDATLAEPLRDELPVGAGSAVFVEGRCTAPPGRSVERLTLALGGAGHPVRCLGDAWWGIVPLAAVTEAVEMPLTLHAELEGGGRTETQLATWRLVPQLDVDPVTPPSRAGDAAQPLIAICMTTFEPPRELFARQIESIRSQTYENWVCVISDDNSRPGWLDTMRAVLGGDERFTLVPSSVRRGFFENFERALALAPPEAPYIGFADQDDRWDPDKLEVLAAELEGGADLAYSDTRVIDEGGRVVSDTYFRYRTNNYTDLTSLLITNSITGAAALFRREVAERALPFPPAHGDIYHDHWLALVAMATGEIRYVDRALYDYVQHSGATLGFADANAGRGRWGGRLADLALRVLRLGYRFIRPVGRVRYFENYCRLALEARALEVRFGDALPASKLRALRRIQACDTSLAGLGWLGWRALRPLAGRNETMGNERGLFTGLLWRRTASLRARRARRRRTG